MGAPVQPGVSTNEENSLKRILFFGLLLLALAAAALARESTDRIRELEKKVEELQQRLDRLAATANETTRMGRGARSGLVPPHPRSTA